MFRQRRSNHKYGNTFSTYNGIQYHSKLEAAHAQDLDILLRAGEVKEVKRQVLIKLVVNGYLVCNYYIDFVVEHNDGVTEYIEVKGFETPEWRLKWKLFVALFSDVPMTKLTVIKA